jgi:predicted Zn-dependent protease
VNDAGAAGPMRAFDAVAVLGTIDAAVIPRGRTIDTADSAQALGASGRLDVDAAIAWARRHRARGERVLLLTDRDLFIPEVGSLFGFADRKSSVAIVSTYRLAAGDAGQLRHRVTNAIAHEAGHLDGLKHCQRSCLMRPAAEPADLDTRPLTPCGRCPRRWTWITKSAIAFFVLLLTVEVATRVLEWRAPPRVAPAIPVVLTATFAEFPRDPDAVFSRPVTMVAQILNGAEERSRLAIVPFPPGLTPVTLSPFATAITSAIFRTVEPRPLVYVHVLELRLDTPDVPSALGCAMPANTTAAYRSCHVGRDGSDVHVVMPRAGGKAIVVFSPDATGRDMAERLAATVGTSAGLLRDRDVNLLLGALPPVLPAGFTLDSIVFSNIHRMPEGIEHVARSIAGRDQPAAVAQLRRVMPLAVAVAQYRQGDRGRVAVMIADYNNPVSAWLSMGGIEELGRTLTGSGSDRFVHVRRGPYVVLVSGDGPGATVDVLQAIANAVQL